MTSKQQTLDIEITFQKQQTLLKVWLWLRVDPGFQSNYIFDGSVITRHHRCLATLVRKCACNALIPYACQLKSVFVAYVLWLFS